MTNFIDWLINKISPKQISPIPENVERVMFKRPSIESTLAKKPKRPLFDRLTQKDRPTPSPTRVPNQPNPYLNLVNKYFPREERNRASNVMLGESSLDPNMAHINSIKQKRPVKSAKDIQNLIDQYGSIDVGLYQHNLGTPTGDALLRYMETQGLDLEDLLDPEINTKLAYDRWVGNIKDIVPGWQQWYTKYAEEVPNY